MLISGCRFLKCTSRVSPRLKDLVQVGQGYFGPVPAQRWRFLFLLRYLVPLVVSTVPQVSHFQLSSVEFVLKAGVIGLEACEESLGGELLRDVGLPAAWTSARCPCRNGAEVSGESSKIVFT